MLFLHGSPAYNSFRLQQIYARLHHQFSYIHHIHAHYGYFVGVQTELNADERERLKTLLPEAEYRDLPTPESECAFWVVPRLGTISPWSSKATDIAHHCALEKINRIERGIFYRIEMHSETHPEIIRELHDPLTESVLFPSDDLSILFQHPPAKTVQTIPVLEKGEAALEQVNRQMGLALSKADIRYLLEAFQRLRRNPTDIELMMFAQVNSEHCRHKIFNARWTIDGQRKKDSLFSMIRYTNAANPDQVLVAYQDNAAIIKGAICNNFFINAAQHVYEMKQEALNVVFKVETHNHPTGISPFPGAATGSGGEIRDEAATGRGAQSRAGLTGFSVSHLHIPGFSQPWETCVGKPKNLSSPLEIMLRAPVGAASFNNEFGRPNICGYFRTLEMMVLSDYGDICRGYHKPIMIVGGIGQISECNVQKKQVPQNALLIVLGGPGMAIGLGGGSASSHATGDSNQALDFASVQRANPEMQRRAQEVINHCISLGDVNPILSIHDVGAGGLSNALPELVETSERGAAIELRAIPSDEPGMSPLEIWCNEAQERFVLAIKKESLELFRRVAHRERCPFAVLGQATSEKNLLVSDKIFHNDPINLPLSLLFDEMPRLERHDDHTSPVHEPLDFTKIDLADAVKRVLQYPCVSDKSFLITIGDRSVGGLVARDQMVGPWQVPVADVGVITHDFTGYSGQALAMGERAPIAMIHHAASARMAVSEAITNIAAAPIEDLSQIVLSANWMAAADYPGEGAGLYDAVQSIGLALCPALGISIPVGKDSLSMRTSWVDKSQKRSVTSPLSLVVSATAPVTDARKTLTPQLRRDVENTCLVLIDLGKSANLLGGSCLAQAYNVLGQQPPDVDDPALLKNFFKAIQSLNQHDLVLAYHDRSDGGLLVTVCEMAFAGYVGVTMDVTSLGKDPVAGLFSEELGAVIQIKKEHLDTVLSILEGHDLETVSHVIGQPNETDEIIIYHENQSIFSDSRINLHRLWSETSYRLHALRDNPDCAQQQYDQLLDANDSGLFAEVTFNTHENKAVPFINKNTRPRVAILREQGVNGHVEMAAAFYLAGFESVDVHMSDLAQGRIHLKEFKGLVAGGGFSYGDVLGAGRGWAQSILMHPKIRDEFAAFFQKSDSFSLGVCNGCQMFSQLKDIIPGAEHWPRFLRNESEQFEARLSLVVVPPSPSIFFSDMHGSVLPIAVAHGEGRTVFSDAQQQEAAESDRLVALRYVDNRGKPTEKYPANPNGSPRGITGLTTRDGRVTILMPHPERVFRTVQLSWHPAEWGEESPWMRVFQNARTYVA